MKKRLSLGRGQLFEPSVVRNNETAVSDLNFSNFDFKSNDDLLYDIKKPKQQLENSGPNSKFGKLFSTNELNIDYSKFQNHTFFDSAVSKTNISFDRVVNTFPFDGTREDINNFRENSTGFETYVLDNFPTNKGYLKFQNDESHHILIKDQQGYLYATDNEKLSLIIFRPLFFLIFYVVLPQF